MITLRGFVYYELEELPDLPGPDPRKWDGHRRGQTEGLFLICRRLPLEKADAPVALFLFQNATRKAIEIVIIPDDWNKTADGRAEVRDASIELVTEELFVNGIRNRAKQLIPRTTEVIGVMDVAPSRDPGTATRDAPVVDDRKVRTMLAGTFDDGIMDDARVMGKVDTKIVGRRVRHDGRIELTVSWKLRP